MLIRPTLPDARAGSARWFLLAFLLLLLLGAAGAVWLRQSNFADPVYTPIPDASTATVSGRAVDGNGDPVADLALTWFQAEGEAQGGLFLGGRMFGSTGEDVVTGPGGTFRFEGLSPATGFVEVASSHAILEGKTGQFEARAGFDAGALELRVEQVSAKRRALVKLTYPDGTPAAKVKVKAQGKSWKGSWSSNRLTDASGEVEFVSPWKKGTFVLEVTGSDGTQTTAEDVPMGRGTVEQTVHR